MVASQRLERGVEAGEQLVGGRSRRRPRAVQLRGHLAPSRHAHLVVRVVGEERRTLEVAGRPGRDESRVERLDAAVHQPVRDLGLAERGERDRRAPARDRRQARRHVLGGEDEHGRRRRLLERLQQRRRAPHREVHVVDDEDLAHALDGPSQRPRRHLADLVDGDRRARCARTLEMSGCTPRSARAAAVADPAAAVRAHEPRGEPDGGRLLRRARWPEEEVGVDGPRERRAQRGDRALLADDPLEERVLRPCRVMTGPSLSAASTSRATSSMAWLASTTRHVGDVAASSRKPAAHPSRRSRRPRTRSDPASGRPSRRARARDLGGAVEQDREVRLEAARRHLDARAGRRRGRGRGRSPGRRASSR